MIEYIQLENGETIEFLEHKNKQVIASLQEILEDFRGKEARDKSGKKRFGFMMQMQIEDCLGKYGRMSADEFVSLTAEDIDDLWWHFHSLMAYFNRFFEIVPNRQSFLLYARLNSRQYKQLMDNQDDDIRSVIAFIEDRLIGKGFSAGESGNASNSAVMSRLKSADVGHNVVDARDEKIINAVAGKTPQELEREMKAILGGGDFKALK
jgi:hypothetical protein